MTLLEIRQAALRKVGDNAPASPTYYTNAEANAVINEGLRLFCLLTLAVERTATLSLTANQPFYDVHTEFSDWIVPLRLRSAAGRKLRPTSLGGLQAKDYRWQATRLAYPERYAVMGSNLLIVSPQVAVPQNASVTYAAFAAALSADGDIPETPVQTHQALVSYAAATLTRKEGGGEFGEALRWWAEFREEAAKHALIVRKRGLMMGYDKLPPELSSGD